MRFSFYEGAFEKTVNCMQESSGYIEKKMIGNVWNEYEEEGKGGSNL